DLGHLDGRLDPGRLALALEGGLQVEGVDDRGQHAHVVALGAVQPGGGRGLAPPDVAAADHDGDLRVEGLADLDHLGGDQVDDRLVDPEVLRAGEGLTGELEDDPPPVPGCSCVSVRSRVGAVGAHDPISTWAKRTIVASPSMVAMVWLSSRTYFWSSSTRLAKNRPWSSPSTIFSMACSGLPSLRVSASSSDRSSAISASGTWSRVRYGGRAKA